MPSFAKIQKRKKSRGREETPGKKESGVGEYSHNYIPSRLSCGKREKLGNTRIQAGRGFWRLRLRCFKSVR